jgi:hypothetical protein
MEKRNEKWDPSEKHGGCVEFAREKREQCGKEGVWRGKDADLRGYLARNRALL